MEKFRRELTEFVQGIYEADRKVLVFGEGRVGAPVMMIGEAPGEQETLLGRPFVGKAGKNLDAFLEQARRHTFAVSGMVFQDAWNLDLKRLKRCYICEMDSEHGMVPFCAYNLTDQEGKALYRR